MTELKKVYWDACVWIALINEEPDKISRCRAIMEQARKGEIEIWTSSLTLAEVFKKKCEGNGVSLPENKDVQFESFIEQDFLKEVQVDHDIGVEARRLLRKHPLLKKPNDGVHLATAVLYNVDEFHTFDDENFLPLNGQITRADGIELVICHPPQPIQGALDLTIEESDGGAH